MRLKRRLLGVFTDPHEAAEAARDLQKMGHCHIEVYSPVPDHHLLDAAPPRWKPVRYFTITGGILGLISGFALAIWTAVFQVGGDGTWDGGLWLNGMPPLAPIPFVIVGFEVTILVGGLMTMLGLLIGSRLPKFLDPPLWDVRLSEDHFGIGIDCIPAYTDRFEKVLKAHGAEYVHRAQ
jgi:hypothetical protein